MLLLLNKEIMAMTFYEPSSLSNGTSPNAVNYMQSNGGTGSATSTAELTKDELFVIQQSSAITHLFAKLFDDTIHPEIRDTQIEDSVLRKRDQTLRNVEDRINIGVRRQLNAVIAFVRHVLSTSQRKSDFKPEEDNYEMSAACSSTCTTVVNYLNRVVQNADKCGIKDCVDGGNLRVILAELGDNFYATILAHVLSFAYNLAGAMLLLCDISVYKKCISSWGIAELEKNLDCLHALANLLVVVPENLPEACNSQLLKNVDRPLMNEFIQRRHDYKSAKLFLNTY
uniref:Exocyst complex component 5 n=1 Tax=Globodera pallida TaxID=36090 RepID=A0A183BMU4_GLOPA